MVTCIPELKRSIDTKKGWQHVLYSVLYTTNYFTLFTATEKQYKIPVRFWLPKAFPKEGPSVQIHPSPDMVLTAVDYVDADGIVTIPYLKHWKEVRLN